MSIDSNRRQAPGHGCLQENMNKSLRLQTPSDEDKAALADPEKRVFRQCTSAANTRPVNGDLLDRIQIWMNEGGAGDDAR